MSRAARQLLWFGVAGAGGFVVDAGLLYALKGLLGLYGARAVSFLGAVVFTWLLNRTVTFRQQRSGRPLLHEFGVYLMLMLGGGTVNYGVYALLVSRYALLTEWPVVAVAAGSVAGLIVNFLSSRFVLFRTQQA